MWLRVWMFMHLMNAYTNGFTYHTWMAHVLGAVEVIHRTYLGWYEHVCICTHLGWYERARTRASNGWRHVVLLLYTIRYHFTDGMPCVVLWGPEALDCSVLIPPEAWSWLTRNPHSLGFEPQTSCIWEPIATELSEQLSNGLLHYCVSRAVVRHAPKRSEAPVFLGGITCLTLLVYYGLICFMRSSSCQGSKFATCFATFEESMRQTSSVRQDISPEW